VQSKNTAFVENIVPYVSNPRRSLPERLYFFGVRREDVRLRLGLALWLLLRTLVGRINPIAQRMAHCPQF
jgi:hypothetical protein